MGTGCRVVLICGEFRRRFVGLGEPDFTFPVISNQLFVLCGAHVSRPNDFGMIDVRFVVYPLSGADVMIGTVTHQHQLTTWKTR